MEGGIDVALDALGVVRGRWRHERAVGHEPAARLVRQPGQVGQRDAPAVGHDVAIRERQRVLRHAAR